MRQYRNLKKGILMTTVFSLWAGSLLSLSGCGNEKDAGSYAEEETKKAEGESQGEEKAMGRYLESDLNLPKECDMADSIEFLEDGTLRICYKNSDYQAMYADSRDNGETWGEPVSIPALLGLDPETVTVDLVKPAKDGGIFARAYSEEKPDEPSSRHYYIDPEGNAREMNLEALGEGFYIWDCEFTGKQTILIRTITEIAEVSLKDDHIETKYEEGGGTQYMGLVDHYLLAVADGGIHYYDIDTGKPIEDESAFTKLFAANEQNLSRNTTSSYTSLFLAGDEKDSLFFVDKRGIYRYAFGGSIAEQIADGNLNSLNSPDTALLDMVKDSQGRFYLLISDYSSGRTARILRYEYSEEVAAVPDTELTVYSLKESRFMRQAAAIFQKKYPDIYLNLETGMTGEDAVTTTDALKTLNTEIMAGKGPDVLILDGISEETYVEKGLLADLSGILSKVQETDGILENILDPYKKEDGNIYSMPVKFAIPVMAGHQEDIEKVTDLASLADLVEAHQDEYKLENGRPVRMPMNQVCSPELLLTDLADVSAGAWLKEDGTLDEEALTQYLAQANRMYQPTREMMEEALGEDQIYYFYDQQEMKYGINATDVLDGQCIVGLGRIYSSDEIANLYSTERYDDSIHVKLWNGQEENCFIPIQTIGISAKAREKDAAEKFVEFLFSQEGQGIGASNGIPVNKAVFHNADYWKKGEEDEILWVSSHSYNDGSSQEQTFECRQQTEAYTEQFLAMAESLEKPSKENEFILSAVRDAGTRYLKGECSLDEAVKAAVQEVNLYLSE